MNPATAETPVPSPFDVRDLLEGLLGRDVDVRVTDPLVLAPGEQATYAVYVDDRLRTRAVALADLPLSAYAGAAIALVPAPTAAETIEAGVLDELLAENFHEVLNVCAATLNAEGVPHVKLHAVYVAGSTPPTDVVSYASVPGRRLDLLVDVARYGTGRFSMVCVA